MNGSEGRSGQGVLHGSERQGGAPVDPGPPPSGDVLLDFSDAINSQFIAVLEDF